MSKAIVIGAGITGITTAYSLARRGYKVTVIEREPYAAMMTSYANGGQLSVSNSEVWTTWSNIFKALKWLRRSDAPLLFNPSPGWSKYVWVAKFLANTALMQYHSNTVKTIEMGLMSRELYYRIAEEEKIQFDLKKKGILHIYENPSYFDAAKKSLELYNKSGVKRVLLNRAEAVDIEPSLAENNNIIGGTYTPNDAMGDIHKFCVELARVLETKYKVVFNYSTDVNSIDLIHNVVALMAENTEKNTSKTYVADHVVICSGVGSNLLARMVNDSLPIYPVKGYSITLDLPSTDETGIYPQVSLLDDEAKIVSSTLGRRLRVAGTAEINGYNLDIRRDRVVPLIKWVRRNFPKISTEHAVPWAGLRPMTPSMMPVIRPSRMPHVWFNTGHGHLGWTLSAATAEMIADQIDFDPNDNTL